MYLHIMASWFRIRILPNFSSLHSQLTDFCWQRSQYHWNLHTFVNRYYKKGLIIEGIWFLILDRIRIRSNFDSRINIRHRPLFENRIRIQPYYFKTRIRNPTCLIIIIIIDTIFQGISYLEARYVCMYS